MDTSQFPDKILTRSLPHMSPPSKRVYTFGDFRLDASERLLYRSNQLLQVTPKVVEALLLLVENAGHLVEKEVFMKRLWPDTFVGDDTLAQNISLLRKAIADGEEGPALIVTVPRRGYRFVGAVHQSVETRPAREPELAQQGGPGIRSLPLTDTASLLPFVQAARAAGQLAVPTREQSMNDLPPALKRERWRVPMRRAAFVLAVICTGALAGILTYALLSPTPVPKVTRTTQITYSGKVDPWGRILTDGVRLYFLEREGDHWNLTQNSVNGGDSQVLSAPFRSTYPFDISSDHSQFLIGQFTSRETHMPLWTWPVQGGSPTRVGNIEAYDAAWSPDAQTIAYAQADGLYLTDRNGSISRKLTATSYPPFGLAWSPDGSRIRYYDDGLLEIGVNGTGLRHPLEAGKFPAECCGRWAPDGAAFFLFSRSAGPADIWLLREKRNVLGTREAPPFRLTAGPGDFGGVPLPSADGRKLYTIKTDLKSELLRYDQKNGAFSPVVFGLNVYAGFSYSPDGQWIAYLQTPDSKLWRMRYDGTDRRAIASAPLGVSDFAWSPDGKSLAFTAHDPQCDNRLYVVSAEGGNPTVLFPNQCAQIDPSWTPDGKRISFGRLQPASPGGPETSTIQTFDIETHQLSDVPRANGMRAPSWSPDGRYLATLSDDLHKLYLLDLRTQRWSELATGTLFTIILRWSPDSSFLYFQDLLGENQPVYRVRLNDHRRDVVVSFEAYIRAGIPRCAFLGLSPDQSLLVSILRSNADIYALDIQLP